MLRLIRPLLIIIILGLLLYWTNTKYHWANDIANKFQVAKTNLAISNSWAEDTWLIIVNTWDTISSWSVLSWIDNSWSDESYDILSNLQKFISGSISSWVINTWNTNTWTYIPKNIIDISWQNSFVINLLMNFPQTSSWSVSSWSEINSGLSASCQFRDQIVKNWNYIIAYRQKYATTCTFEKRYCDQWQLYGKYIYDTCIYGQMFSDSLDNWLSNIISWNSIGIWSNASWSNILNSWSSSIWDSTNTNSVSETNANSQNTSKSGNNININNTKAHLVDDYDDVTKYVDEFVNNYKSDEYSDNSSIYKDDDYYEKYPGGSKSFGIKKSLDDRQEKVDKVMSDNRTSTPKTLEQYVAMMKPTDSWSDTKNSALTTEQQYPSTTTNSQIKKWCVTPRGTNINNWQTIIAYQSAATTFPKTCEFESRYCDNGKLWWSFAYQNCEFWQLEYNTTLDKKSYYIYSDNATTFYPNYISKPIWAWFYLINGGYSYTTLSAQQWCRANNVYIPNWESKAFYKYNTVGRGETCSLSYRKCVNWSLLWDQSYTFVYCKQNDPASCRAPGYNTYIPHWSSKIYYNNTNLGCNSEYRYCDNGRLWWSYTNINWCSNTK